IGARAEAEARAQVREEAAASVACIGLGAGARREKTVPELEPLRLALGADDVVHEVRLERSVAAEHEHVAAREAGAEREADARGAALGARGDGPLVVERLARIEDEG